jgi:hypothetical protein
VRRLVDSFARLLKPLIDDYPAPVHAPAAAHTQTQTQTAPMSVSGERMQSVTDTSATPAAAGTSQVRQWQQGKGVVMTTVDPVAIALEADREREREREKRAAGKRGTDKLSKMLRDAPKPEKVGMALYGMQGLSSRYDSVRTIMDLLLPFVKNMPTPTGKVVGMAFQCFKSCTGRPTGSHAEVLNVLSKRTAGWSGRKDRDSRGEYSSRSAPASDVQVTLRSALWGISRLDRQTPTVRDALRVFAAEVLLWDPRTLDAKTLSSLGEQNLFLPLSFPPVLFPFHFPSLSLPFPASLSLPPSLSLSPPFPHSLPFPNSFSLTTGEVYKGGEIENEAEVSALLAHISPFSTPSRGQNMDKLIQSDRIKTERDYTSSKPSLQSSQKVNIENVVSALDGDLGFDEVRKYYGMSKQNTIPPGNLFSLLPLVIEEIKQVEEVKLSRKLKIDARHERQKIASSNSPETGGVPSTIYPGTTSPNSSERAPKQHRPPRANIEDSPNRGKKWVQKSVRESVPAGGTV